MNQKNRLHCWKVEKLENLGKWGSGGTPLSSVKDYYGGNIKWAIIGDLNDSIIYETKNKITQKGLENSSSKLVPKNSLLIAMYGSIGKTAITGDEIATNQAIAFLIPKKEVDVHFVQHFIHLNVSNLFHLSRGGTQKNINQEILKSFEIPLPTLPEQTLIVQEIEKQFTRLDEAVKSLKSVKAKLEVYRKAVLKKAFEKKEDWEEKILGELVETRKEKSNPQNFIDKTYIGMADVESNSGKILEKHLAEEMKATSSNFYKGDVLYGRLRPYLNKVIDAEFEGLCSTEFIILIPKKNMSFKFIGWRLRNKDFVDFANSLNSGDRPRVKFNQISRFKFPIPSKEEQTLIVQEIESKFSVIDKIEQVVNESLEKSEKLRKSILKSAFEGKLVKMEEVGE